MLPDKHTALDELLSNITLESFVAECEAALRSAHCEHVYDNLIGRCVIFIEEHKSWRTQMPDDVSSDEAVKTYPMRSTSFRLLLV